MYGGLFGDLPAAKNSQIKQEESSSPVVAAVKKEEVAAVKKEEVEGAQTQAQPDTQNDNKKRKVEEPKVVKGPSLVQTLGKAGTSMAFIPTHLNRKRNAVKNTVKKAQAKVTSTPSSNNAPPQPQASTTKFAVLKDATTEKTSVPKDTPVQNEGPSSSTSFDIVRSGPEEPEELQRLHENVTDPYDPIVPNDLLQYWERKAAILERKEIEREAKETLEQQQLVREQLERERQELEKTGDVSKIVEHRQRNAIPGRGRGRGISNLPAWVIERQKEEARLGESKDA